MCHLWSYHFIRLFFVCCLWLLFLLWVHHTLKCIRILLLSLLFIIVLILLWRSVNFLVLFLFLLSGISCLFIFINFLISITLLRLDVFRYIKLDCRQILQCLNWFLNNYNWIRRGCYLFRLKQPINNRVLKSNSLIADHFLCISEQCHTRNSVSDDRRAIIITFKMVARSTIDHFVLVEIVRTSSFYHHPCCGRALTGMIN